MERGTEGVITGGTGEFQAATGVYTDAAVSGGARATLLFSQRPTGAFVDQTTIQDAITAYMRDNRFRVLPSGEANDLVSGFSTNDFSAATGKLDLETLGPRGFPCMKATTTIYFYCWDIFGAVTVQDIVATLDCAR